MGSLYVVVYTRYHEMGFAEHNIGFLEAVTVLTNFALENNLLSLPTEAPCLVKIQVWVTAHPMLQYATLHLL